MKFSTTSYFVSALVIFASALIALSIYHSVSLGTTKTSLASALKENEQIRQELLASTKQNNSTDFDNLISIAHNIKSPSWFAVYVNDKNEYSLSVEYDYENVKKTYSIYRKHSIAELQESLKEVLDTK